MTPDPDIWAYAKQHGFTIITKDDDFLALAHRYGPPPKLKMVEIGNCTNTVIAERLLASAARLHELANTLRPGLLSLSNALKNV